MGNANDRGQGRQWGDRAIQMGQAKVGRQGGQRGDHAMMWAKQRGAERRAAGYPCDEMGRGAGQAVERPCN